VPYRVIGGPRFYERQEIRDAIAYLRIILVPEDDLAFERIINVPKRGLGPATMQQITTHARVNKIGMLEAVRQLLNTDAFKPKMRTTLQTFIRLYDMWCAQLQDLPHTDLTERVLEESGYIAMWQAEKTPDAPTRLENLKELISAMSEFDNLQSFMEHVSLVMEKTSSAEQEQVTLMTLHAAKGLEFDLVFLPGWEEEIFPSRRSLEENGMKGLEEERRLAYVGITRARKHAIISNVANRLVYGSWTNAIPSRFISELPAQHIETHAEAGMFGTMNRASFNSRGTSAAPAEFAQSSVMSSSFGKSHYPARPKTSFIEGRAERIEDEPTYKFRKGDRVFHQKFGYGTIELMDGPKIEVTFDMGDTKKIMAEFVVPESLAGEF